MASGRATHYPALIFLCNQRGLGIDSVGGLWTSSGMTPVVAEPQHAQLRCRRRRSADHNRSKHWNQQGPSLLLRRSPTKSEEPNLGVRGCPRIPAGGTCQWHQGRSPIQHLPCRSRSGCRRPAIAAARNTLAGRRSVVWRPADGGGRGWLGGKGFPERPRRTCVANV